MYNRQKQGAGRQAGGESATTDKVHADNHSAGASRTLLVYLILGIISAAFLFLSYALHVDVPTAAHEAPRAALNFTENFLKDLGIAGLVAIFLAITFERLSSEEFRQLAIRERNLAKSDVFYYVYGYGIPETIRDEINTKILKSVFVRNNMDLRYTLRRVVEDGTEYMQVRLVVRYEIQNLTSKRQPFTVVGGLEKPSRPSLQKYVRIENVRVDAAGGQTIVKMGEAELKERKFLRSDDIEELLEVSGVVHIEPRKTVVVNLIYHTVTHYEGGYDYFTLSQHTCKLAVGVHVPNNDVAVALRDFGGEELLTEEAEHNPDEGLYHWYSPTPMLVNQGVYLAWNPRQLTARPVGAEQAEGVSTAEMAPV